MTQQKNLFEQFTELAKEKHAAGSDKTAEEAQPDYYSVSDVTQLMKDALASDPVLGGKLVVRGELSNVSQSSRGHVYFSLKDDDASIKGVIWASLANKLAFDLEDGIEVFVTGSLDIYAPYGTYSIVTQRIEPVGIGAIQLAYLQIKEKLEKEGLFDPKHKKPIPEFPKRIGIVTSPTGAVIHDMLRVLRQKNPTVDVLLAPVTVQGEGAAESIAQAITELNNPAYELDLIIAGRGGGSLEDLFCFSEEVAVRAVFESRLPIITGVGHEPDFSLCDAASDLSASTPTAAAEFAVPDYRKLIDELARNRQELLREFQDWFLFYEQTLDQQATQIIDHFKRTLEMAGRDLEQYQDRLLNAMDKHLQHCDQRVLRFASELDAFSPLETLARGYVIATDGGGKVVKSINDISRGDRLSIRASDGTIDAEVTDLKKN